MNDAGKILKDAAKITDELYPTYGHAQKPIGTLSFYRQKALGLHRDDHEPSARLCLRGGKMVEFSGKQYRYDTQKFLLCASGLPLWGRVEHCSFLSVSIKFQSEEILEALKKIEGQSRAGRLLWLV